MLYETKLMDLAISLLVRLIRVADQLISTREFSRNQDYRNGADVVGRQFSRDFLHFFMAWEQSMLGLQTVLATKIMSEILGSVRFPL